MKQLFTFIKKQTKTLIGIGCGALVGFLYWKFIGCTSGQCPITSSPINSTLYGALLGGLLLNMITNSSKKDDDK